MILNATLGGRYGTRGILAYTAHETDFHRLCSIGDSSFTRSLCPRLNRERFGCRIRELGSFPRRGWPGGSISSAKGLAQRYDDPRIRPVP